MSGRQTAEKLWSNIRDLGARRLIALALVGLAVILSVGFGAYYLSQPEREPLYTGLSRDDVGRIGSALQEAGISFDVSADGASVMIEHGNASRARMLLAEKGLPESGNTGYELFNQVGSFGLTSFMQEVTRTRALEGELARTIQTMDGVKAARIHIVIPDRGSFRSDQQPASASVVIRTANPEDTSAASAIRHLVAAAVPGLKIDNVTILNTEGRVLASGGEDSDGATSGKMELLTKDVNHDVEDKIRRTLVPYLGLENFQVSVASVLNTDQAVTSETVFDPATRVERSVRVVKENAATQNSSDHPPTSVAQNIPDQGAGRHRRQDLERAERPPRGTHQLRDLVEENRYRTQGLHRPEAVDRRPGQQGAPDGGHRDRRGRDLARPATHGNRAAGHLGGRLQQGPRRSAQGHLGQLPRQRRRARGGPRSRHRRAPRPPGRHRDQRRRHPHSCRPAHLVRAAAGGEGDPRPAARDRAGTAGCHDRSRRRRADRRHPARRCRQPAMPTVNLIEDLTKKMNRSPQKRLEQIVEFDEEQAAAILRQWLHQDEKA